MEKHDNLPGVPATAIPRLNEVAEDCKSSQNKRPSWSHLFVFTTRKHMGSLVLAVAAALLVAGVKTLYAVVLGKIFQIVAGFGAGTIAGVDMNHGVSTWAIVLTAMGFIAWFANAAFMAFWIIFGEVCIRSARDTLFLALLAKELGWYDMRADGMSSLLVRIESQTRELQSATSQVFGFIVCDLFIAITCIAVAFYYCWKLTLVLIATIPASFIIISFLSRGLRPAIEFQKRELGEASRYATAAVSAIDLVKAYNGFDHEVWQYLQALKKATRYYLVQARCNCMQMSYIKFWMIALFVVGFWFAIYLVDKGETTAGNAMTTFYATLIALQAAEALGPQWLVIAKGMSAGLNLKEIASDIQRTRGTQEGDGCSGPEECVGDIEITNVGFSYPSNSSRPAIRDASFFFPAGETTFLVGRSGSGKSTLGNLLVKFYEPTTGYISIDGWPLQTLDDGWVRSNVTLIQQTSVLFTDTFHMNVAFGHRKPLEVTRDEIKAACETALLQSTIAELPDGLETTIGPRGYDLSGGQKQRLALARAKLRDPPILILDEVTSGLDPISRSLIMEAIRTWRKGKTTIIVTHEVSQIQGQDYVYVLDQGSVVQEGFQKTLAKNDQGLFATLLASSEEGLVSPSLSDTDSDESDTEHPVPEYDVDSRLTWFFPSLAIEHGNMPGNILNRTSLGAPTVQATRMWSQQIWDAPPLLEAFKQRPSLIYSGVRGQTVCPTHSTRHRRAEVLSNRLDPQDAVMDMLCASGNHAVSSRRITRSTQPATLRRNKSGRGTAAPTPTMNNDQIGSENGKAERISMFKILRTVWPLLDVKHRLYIVAGLVCSVVAGGANPVFSYLFARLLQAFWTTGNRMAVGQTWSIYLIVLAVVDGVTIFISHYLMEVAGQAWVDQVRTEALKRILSQPKSWFDKPQHSATRMIECLNHNAEEMRNLVGRFVPILIIVIVMIGTAIIWAFIISWRLTLVALSSCPVVYAVTRALSLFSDKWETLCANGVDATASIFAEVFTHIRVARALTLESFFTTKYSQSTRNGLKLGIRRGVYTGIFYGLHQAITFWVTALVFWYGTLLITQSQNQFDVAAVLQVINLLLFCMGGATVMLGSMPQISQSKSTAIQLLYYAELDYHAGHEHRGGKRTLTPLPLQTNHLKFVYPTRPSATVLEDVSLVIDPGECVAITGPSGCGKSTLASLLLRLYEPLHSVKADIREETSRHPLTFNGVPAAELDMAGLRGVIAYVPQQPFLFPASIKDNITYGMSDNSHLKEIHNVKRAARAAGIHEFVISLPDGYDTLVGEGGLTLSGGQTQRVCIARALVRKPKLLIMDEPTSALDAESAECVRHTVRSLMLAKDDDDYDRLWSHGRQRMSVVIITHSKEMMRMADRIIMLDQGRVAEKGRYHDLIDEAGRFAAMVNGGWAPSPRKGRRHPREKDKLTRKNGGFSQQDHPIQDLHESVEGTGWIASAREETLRRLQRPDSREEYDR